VLLPPDLLRAPRAGAVLGVAGYRSTGDEESAAPPLPASQLGPCDAWLRVGRAGVQARVMLAA
jgi:hypothetical protein